MHAFLLMSFLINKDTKKALNQKIKDLTSDTTKHYIGKGTFAIAVGMKDDDGSNLLMNDQYFEISYANEFYHRTNNGAFTHNETVIPHGYCNDSYPHVEKDLYDRIGLQNFVCPLSNDYYILSDFNADVSSNFQFKVKKCSNTTENNNH